jgi:hypothetical protein
MKRASYREAVEYIALNDEPEIRDADAMTYYATVQLLAAIFDVTPERVAGDVVKHREKHS